ncbi:MAG: 2-hydroxychromene-2-carboxylate isomerase [Deltaproteobacteria bacterium]|nr:2-hydroxychromene-2-carboxylate isomerase [Deltaproteobacteria bacterium]
MAKLEFFFDCSSPWTYLAFHKIEGVARAHAAQLVWRPILVGGVFNTVNDTVYAAREKPNPRKAKYSSKDLQDWARLYGLTIAWPKVFPVNSVKAMRAAIALEERGKLPAWSRACFESYWGRGEDLSQDAVLEAIAKQQGLDASWLFARIAAPEIKEQLRKNTDELIARGGFGSPTMYVNESDMFFGNDRLPLVEAALKRAG